MKQSICPLHDEQLLLELLALHGADCFRLGVASDYFSGYTEHDPVLCHCFENQDNEPFAAGDVVTLELERKSGVDVLRVRVAGKKPQSRKLKGVPRDSMLYPNGNRVHEQRVSELHHGSGATAVNCCVSASPRSRARAHCSRKLQHAACRILSF